MINENEQIKTPYSNFEKVQRLSKHIDLLQQRQHKMVRDGFQYKNEAVMDEIDHKIDEVTKRPNRCSFNKYLVF